MWSRCRCFVGHVRLRHLPEWCACTHGAPCAQASTLYSNNISKFLLSMGPFSAPEEKAAFRVDHKDDAGGHACRHACAL